MTVQKVLVVLALCSVPVLLLGKPIHEYITFKKKKRQAASRVNKSCRYGSRVSVWLWHGCCCQMDYTQTLGISHTTISEHYSEWSKMAINIEWEEILWVELLYWLERSEENGLEKGQPWWVGLLVVQRQDPHAVIAAARVWFWVRVPNC